MTKKTFIITVSAADFNDDYLEYSVFRDDLIERFAFSKVNVDSIREFNAKFYLRHSKISAIKEVRTLLGLGLRDSKHIVDMAQEKGQFQWASITVTYNQDETFCVSQN